MTIEEARAHIGERVRYDPGPHRPWADPPEEGTITSVNDRFIFVHYDRKKASEATDPADLELLAARPGPVKVADDLSDAAFG